MRQYVDRAGRKAEIVEHLGKSDASFSTYELARIVGMAYSGHFRQLVLEAWREGKIEGCEQRKPNGMKVWYWWDKNRPNSVRQTAMEL